MCKSIVKLKKIKKRQYFIRHQLQCVIFDFIIWVIKISLIMLEKWPSRKLVMGHTTTRMKDPSIPIKSFKFIGPTLGLALKFKMFKL